MTSSSKTSPRTAAEKGTTEVAARSNALYFPYISMPEVDWTFHTLLYWDRLASIVPMDHLYDPEQLTPFMRDLVREGLVEQVFPGAHLHNLPGFAATFERFIRGRVARMQRNPANGARRQERRVRIHMEKMGVLPTLLVALGVAERAEDAWCAVDEEVARLFMAYLATCLGALPHLNAAPVTHDTKYAAVFGHLPSYRRMDSTHRAKARTTILRSLLPRPAEKVTLDQLVRFKARHGDLLAQFRRLVETRAADLARIADADERTEATSLFIAAASQEADEIASAMRITWKKVVFGSMMPLFGSGLALHAAESGNKLAYAGAALSFTGAAYQAIATIRGQREQLGRRPLAYVTHARRLESL